MNIKLIIQRYCTLIFTNTVYYIKYILIIILYYIKYILVIILNYIKLLYSNNKPKVKHYLNLIKFIIQIINIKYTFANIKCNVINYNTKLRNVKKYYFKVYNPNFKINFNIEYTIISIILIKLIYILNLLMFWILLYLYNINIPYYKNIIIIFTKHVFINIIYNIIKFIGLLLYIFNNLTPFYNKYVYHILDTYLLHVNYIYLYYFNIRRLVTKCIRNTYTMSYILYGITRIILSNLQYVLKRCTKILLKYFSTTFLTIKGAWNPRFHYMFKNSMLIKYYRIALLFVSFSCCFLLFLWLLPILLLIITKLGVISSIIIVKINVFLLDSFTFFIPQGVDFLTFLSPKYAFDGTTKVGYVKAVFRNLANKYNYSYGIYSVLAYLHILIWGYFIAIEQYFFYLFAFFPAEVSIFFCRQELPPINTGLAALYPVILKYDLPYSALFYELFDLTVLQAFYMKNLSLNSYHFSGGYSRTFFYNMGYNSLLVWFTVVDSLVCWVEVFCSGLVAFLEYFSRFYELYVTINVLATYLLVYHAIFVQTLILFFYKSGVIALCIIYLPVWDFVLSVAHFFLHNWWTLLYAVFLLVYVDLALFFTTTVSFFFYVISLIFFEGLGSFKFLLLAVIWVVCLPFSLLNKFLGLFQFTVYGIFSSTLFDYFKIFLFAVYWLFDYFVTVLFAGISSILNLLILILPLTYGTFINFFCSDLFFLPIFSSHLSINWAGLIYYLFVTYVFFSFFFSRVALNIFRKTLSSYVMRSGIDTNSFLGKNAAAESVKFFNFDLFLFCQVNDISVIPTASQAFFYNYREAKMSTSTNAYWYSTRFNFLFLKVWRKINYNIYCIFNILLARLILNRPFGVFRNFSRIALEGRFLTFLQDFYFFIFYPRFHTLIDAGLNVFKGSINPSQAESRYNLKTILPARFNGTVNSSRVYSGFFSFPWLYLITAFDSTYWLAGGISANSFFSIGANERLTDKLNRYRLLNLREFTASSVNKTSDFNLFNLSSSSLWGELSFDARYTNFRDYFFEYLTKLEDSSPLMTVNYNGRLVAKNEIKRNYLFRTNLKIYSFLEFDWLNVYHPLFIDSTLTDLPGYPTTYESAAQAARNRFSFRYFYRYFRDVALDTAALFVLAVQQNFMDIWEELVDSEIPVRFSLDHLFLKFLNISDSKYLAVWKRFLSENTEEYFASLLRWQRRKTNTRVLDIDYFDPRYSPLPFWRLKHRVHNNYITWRMYRRMRRKKRSIHYLIYPLKLFELVDSMPFIINELNYPLFYFNSRHGIADRSIFSTRNFGQFLRMQSSVSPTLLNRRFNSFSNLSRAERGIIKNNGWSVGAPLYSQFFRNFWYKYNSSKQNFTLKVLDVEQLRLMRRFRRRFRIHSDILKRFSARKYDKKSVNAIFFFKSVFRNDSFYFLKNVTSGLSIVGAPEFSNFFFNVSREFQFLRLFSDFWFYIFGNFLTSQIEFYFRLLYMKLASLAILIKAVPSPNIIILPLDLLIKKVQEFFFSAIPVIYQINGVGEDFYVGTGSNFLLFVNQGGFINSNVFWLLDDDGDLEEILDTFDWWWYSY